METPASTRAPRGLTRFSWGVLAYNVLVIAWGAFVRATGSGAGCGRHWPLCNGEVVPRAPRLETVIEISHRITSGVAVVAVVALLVWTRRALPRGHRARRAAAWATASIFGEAIIGAGLVLFELVAHDASTKRALSMVLHLGNTFLLLAALAVTAWSCAAEPARASSRGAREGLVRAAVASTTAAMLLLASSGALAALGDTLFPARSLREGLAQDFSPFAHLFVRLRVLHPVLAVTTGLFVIAASSFVRVARPGPRTRVLSRAAVAAFCVQLGAGVLNVALRAPVAMQVVHLVLADATWILLVVSAAEALVGDGAAAATSSAATEPLEASAARLR